LAFAASCDSDETGDSEPSTPSLNEKIAAPGQPPTVPPAKVEGQRARPPEPVVITSGETALGRPYELVLYGTTRGPCLMTLYPRGDTASEGGGACGSGLIPASVDVVSPRGSSSSRESSISGFVDAGVENVEVTYGDGSTAETSVGMIPKGASRQAGGKEPIGMFIAWFPDSQPPAKATITAVDEDGNELGSAEYVSAS
jgi:hypothetical protein